MARNDDMLRRQRETEAGAPFPEEPAHDPEVVAEAMREGVPVAQKEAEAGAEFGVRSSELQQPNIAHGTPYDPVFTGKVDVIGAYNDAMEQARGMGAVGTQGPVTADVIKEAADVLQKYRAGKAQLENRIVDNEEYFRLLHNGRERRRMAGYSKSRYRRNTPWLFSAITNKVADFQDNYPEATILPREASDENAAKQLTAVIPAILEKNGFRNIYRLACTDKVKNGTGIYSVTWDPQLENGLGDVSIRRVDPLNIFWEPGVEDIQQSANVFVAELRRNDDLTAQYPGIKDLKDHLSSPGMSVTRYIYNDSVDTSDHSYVVNWYYKKRHGDRTILHYCQFVNDVVLYATENDPRYAAEGWYRHGKYPFEYDVMYHEVGTPYGFGEIDIGRDTQEDIDEIGDEMLRNIKTSARRRWLSRQDGGINEQEYMDLERDIVHVQGTIDDTSVREITVNPMSATVLDVYAHKIDELKETTANRDVTQGGTGGTQTASGIAALQESGNKVSRDLIASSYESFKRICELIIELVRQFYDVPRSIRITGDNGSYEFMEMSNAALQSREVPGAFGIAAYQTAEPVFDVTVKAYKANPYSKQQANQDAINMYGMGFFQPENGVQALACLELLDMDNKDKAKQIITANYEAYMQAQQQAMQQMMQMRAAGMPAQQTDEPEPEQQPKKTPAVKSDRGGSSIVDRARQNAQQGTQPR